MKNVYICGLAQELGEHDRFHWMQVYGAHDTLARARDWILGEVDEAGVPGERLDDDDEGIDPSERQYFEELERRSFYFVQEKGVNTGHLVTWRLMSDRSWRVVDGWA